MKSGKRKKHDGHEIELTPKQKREVPLFAVFSFAISIFLSIMLVFVSADIIKESTLAQAETSLKKRDMLAAKGQYQHFLLRSNAIAVNNLGYIYSHGSDESVPWDMRVPQDLELAAEYYLKASGEYGSSQAAINYFVLLYQQLAWQPEAGDPKMELIHAVQAGAASGDTASVLFAADVYRAFLREYFTDGAASEFWSDDAQAFCDLDAQTIYGLLFSGPQWVRVDEYRVSEPMDIEEFSDDDDTYRLVSEGTEDGKYVYQLQQLVNNRDDWDGFFREKILESGLLS